MRPAAIPAWAKMADTERLFDKFYGINRHPKLGPKFVALRTRPHRRLFFADARRRGRSLGDGYRVSVEKHADYSAGNTASTPFFFTKTTTNFAGFVALALRPTVCTSLGPS